MYQFTKIALEMRTEQGSPVPLEVLCRLCEDDCTPEQCAELLGRLWALFGQPDASESCEDFYSYAVNAQQGESSIPLLVAQYGGVPTIYGAQEDVGAAGELAALLRSTPPVDYSWTGVYEDYDLEMTYRMQDGMASVEERSLGFWDEETEILNHIIDRVFEVLSPEEANAWAERYTTPEEMVGYWNRHPELH